MFTYGPWSVRPVSMTGAGRPLRAAALPGCAAEHLVVTHHGVIVATAGSVAELAAVLPFPLTHLAERGTHAGVAQDG